MFIVFLKELKEVLRDRRTLIFMFLVPTIIVPMLMNLLIGFTMHIQKKARTETLKYAIFGQEYLPELDKAFENEQGFEKIVISSPNDVNSAIASEQIKFAIIIPDSAKSRLDDSN